MLIEERFAATRVPQAPSGMASAAARARSGPMALVVGSIALAALSLLSPSAPTYDPWSWIIWGREIAHLDLVTSDGPSWKPLPVAFTTVFSLLGSSVAPALWLVVARAGAIAAIPLAFRVTRRLGGGIPGGVAAAAALAIAPWWYRNAALGNSEGLIVFFLLAAIDRELAGSRRAAFLLAVGAALLRPEAWPFLGLYGAWLLWRRALPWPLVVGLGLGVVALWTVPEWLGSGDALRAAHRAKVVNAGAPTYADNPIVALLDHARGMLTGPLQVALAAGLGLLAARRDRALAVVVALAVAWLALVAYMTQDGFSGNQRYLMAPVVLGIVVAGAGAGWVLDHAVRLAVRRAPRPAAGFLLRRGGMAAVAVVVGVGFAAPSLAKMSPTIDNLRYQAHLANSLGPLVRDAGGAAALRRCGHAFTGPFLVPVVAWNLRVHVNDVDLAPERPAVVFRVKTNPWSRPVPTLRDVGDEHTAAANGHWRIVTACGGAGG